MQDPSSIDGQVAAAANMAQGGRLDLAAPALDAALRLQPDHAEGNRLMALIMMHSGNPQRAMAHIDRAIAAAPQRPDLHATRGSLLASLNQVHPAIASLEHALTLDPRSAPVHGLLATLFLQLKNYDAAEDHYREALAANPRFAEARTNLGSVLGMTARQDEALSLFREGVRLHPDHPGLLTNFCVALNYADGIDHAEIRTAHHRYGHVLAALPGQLQANWPNARDPERRLRIGFLSPDFFEHSVAYFTRPIVEGLDRARFHVSLYSTGGRPDTMTTRLQRAADTWKDLSRANDQQLVDAIRADQVDILVELSGQTFGNRLAALRLRAAPVQVTYCGYPNTTGLRTIDYRIVDSITDPIGGPGAEAMAVERLIRLDPCFLCYSPPEERSFHDAWTSTQAPAARDFITFGSFNSIKKVTPGLLRLWAKILHEVPRARLVLKSQGLETPRARTPILDVLKREGVPEVRVDLWTKIDDKGAHLDAYNAIDIALDTFPYNGTTTTCEALFMGVPVVTLTGQVHAARVGASLLSALGTPELIAEDPDRYVQLAAALAADPARLARYRDTLRATLLASPLCDRAAFTGRFGEALRSMWRTWCAGT